MNSYLPLFNRKTLALALLFVIGLVAVVAVTNSTVVANEDRRALDALCAEFNDASSAPEICREHIQSRTATPGGQGDGVVAFLGEVINIFSIVVGIASVIAIFIGGLFYITSAGDPQKATRGRNTILYAVIGVVVAVLSQLIVLFVLDRLEGAQQQENDTESSMHMRYNA